MIRLTVTGDWLAHLREFADAPLPRPPMPPDPAPVPPTTTILASGPEGPAVIAVYDAATKTTWLTLRGYEKRDGDGGFLSFQNMNTAGKFFDAILLNGGLVDATPGNEQGDLDVLFYVDGKPANVSFCGRYAGQPPGLMPWPSELLNAGGTLNRYAELWLKEYPPRPGMPAGVTRCVKVNGGYVPIYD
jgi:hypothetical protein